LVGDGCCTTSLGSVQTVPEHCITIPMLHRISKRSTQLRSPGFTAELTLSSCLPLLSAANAGAITSSLLLILLPPTPAHCIRGAVGDSAPRLCCCTYHQGLACPRLMACRFGREVAGKVSRSGLRDLDRLLLPQLPNTCGKGDEKP
jgi:hypothetical protein